MLPFIRPGDLLTVRPLEGQGPRVGDVILYQVAGQRLIAHRVIGVKGMGFTSAMPSSAFHRSSFRCVNLIPLREVECREALDSAPNKPDPVGRVSTANPPSRQPAAVPSHRVGTATRGSDMPDMLHVRGDRLWAPLELVHPAQVLGQVVAIERNGHAYQLTRARHRLFAWAWIGLRPFVRAARSRLGKVKRRVLRVKGRRR